MGTKELEERSSLWSNSEPVVSWLIASRARKFGFDFPEPGDLVRSTAIACLPSDGVADRRRNNDIRDSVMI